MKKNKPKINKRQIPVKYSDADNLPRLYSNGGIPQYGWGAEHQGALTGAGTGALNGAMMGSAFGPWGTLIGGVAGAGIGAFKGNAQDEAQKKALAQQQTYDQQQLATQQINQMQYNPQMNNYSNGGYNIPKGVYSNGGMANAQLEKQENFLTPNGSYGQMNASSHEQQNNQSIPDGNINIPQGTKIFSDKLKPIGSKKTFADLNKINNTKKDDKIIDDEKSTSLAKSTANSLKEFKLKNSERLFQSQEQLKQDKVNNYAKRMGLNSYKPQFSNGGIKQYEEAGLFNNQGTPLLTSEEKNRLNYENDYRNTVNYGDQYNYNQNASVPFDESQNEYVAPANQEFTNNQLNALDYPKDNQNKYSNIAGLASLAGPIYGLATNKKLPKANFQTPDYLKYDPTSELRQNAMAAKFQRTMLKDNVGGNAGAYLANINQIGASSAERDAKTLRDSYNINSQGYNQNQRDVANIRNQEMDYRRKDDAGYRDKNENNINQIGMGVSQFALDNKATNQDQDTLDIISQMYPNYSYNKSKRGWYHNRTGEKLNPKKTT